MATATDRAGARLLVELGRELESLRLMATVNRIVGRDVSAWLDDDDASLDLIVDDVTRKWLSRTDSDPQTLDGPDSFWSRYANRVEWAPPDSDDEYRVKFCPSDRDDFDPEQYFRAVWRAHVAELGSAAVNGEARRLAA
jgi:hypothetical protein